MPEHLEEVKSQMDVRVPPRHHRKKIKNPAREGDTAEGRRKRSQEHAIFQKSYRRAVQRILSETI